MSNRLFRILFFALVFLLILQFFGNKNGSDQNAEDIVLSGKDSFSIGQQVMVDIKNNTDSEISIPLSCPNNPLEVSYYENGEWLMKDSQIDEPFCDQYPENITIAAGKNYQLEYSRWNWDLFSEQGKYKVSLITEKDGTEKVYSHEFNVDTPSLIKRIWVEGLYRPIFNVLVFLISILPHHSLGWGIILLTLLIKLILLGPNHKALRAQKQMQKIQPQLEALKIKYKNDPQRLTQETMSLWKKYKVSPMSSCMPMLIQFPILIALFYVVKDGLDVVNPMILYSNLRFFDLQSIDPNFLGIIDLTQINLIVLPIIVGGLQFLQMHLTLGKQKEVTPAKQGDINPLPMMNKMMKYFMPGMIAVFTASLPAAVGFYWGTSTLFGIVQQLFVNRMKD